ncbi:putative coactivator CBP, KIX domain superfamily, mediator complex subunit 15, KIX [Helianthus annuus]|nr:putative coactivator CBP, KIX domain superfamily, mediator complex subunit 15, KIX [Helianthus annuus]KAJ0601911.1 putative coactivator CBP, KIX domain superfamily, mediator complex subunit 15, KIX [Helianthus annuus]KAJ0608897.1 putative coactivator CBP, KIX domain superfamily, mediator complex subunit 15, KIX [Helianthus annuus]KAJ0936746.1 putative coactivator CBP, KIX domain superfamily, mediator complex subunit 15, KIX [Helianthus annuus]KAJ0944653.1 putative coactivator CBP, KIX domain
MQWIIRFSGFVSAALVTIVLAPSLQSFHPAEAIRSHSHSHIDGRFRHRTSSFRHASEFRNATGCVPVQHYGDVCDQAQVSSRTAGDPAMELQADSREGMVNKILDTLKRNLPFTRHEDLQELKNIAKWIEEESYVAATSQSEYSRKICLMTLNMETRLQSDYDALYKRVHPSLPSDSTASGGDWQEEVYQKIKAMKELYLLDLSDLHQRVVSKLQPRDSLSQQLENEQLEKLKVFKNTLEHYMQFLQTPKHGILPNFKDKLGTYEKWISTIINLNKRKPGSAQQQSQA